MKREHAGLSLAVVGAAALAGAYAMYVEPRWLKRTHTKLHFRTLPAALEGVRIALLTDMHVGSSTPSHLLTRAVTMAMAARPHMIAVTGDLVDTAADLPSVLDRLAALHAPLGVYVVPGNHDHHMGIDRWHTAVEQHPALTDLTNRAIVLHIPQRGVVRDDADGNDGVRLCVAGVDDFDEGEPSLDMLPPPAARDFTILLAHQPDQAERVRREADDIDLVLSGHTHGGQVRLPGIGAVVNSAHRDDLYEKGVRRRPWTQVYTSVGLGTVHLPVRFMARPEVAILELTNVSRIRWREDR